MDKHTRIVGILFIVSGTLTLIFSLIVFLSLGLAGGIAAMQGETEAAGILGRVIRGVCGLLSALALPEIIGGWALLAGHSWGRILVLVLAVFNLFSIPFGTALGIYALWALLREDQGITPRQHLA